MVKKVSDLYSEIVEKDVYIVGTGPSFRLYDKSFFHNKIVIGLNKAIDEVDCKYLITIHPDLVLNNSNVVKNTIFILPQKKTQELLDPALYSQIQDKVYFFEYFGKSNTAGLSDPSNSGRIIDWVLEPTNDNLYVWSSISQTAMNFAANLGYKNIFLVGCDNMAISGNHHNSKQHTRWNGSSSETRYYQYYLGCKEVRNVLIKRGVNVFSLTPFVGLGNLEEDFKSQCEIKNLPHLIQEPDITSDHYIIKQLLRRLLAFFMRFR